MIVDEEEAHGKWRGAGNVVEAQYCGSRVQLSCKLVVQQSPQLPCILIASWADNR